MEGQPAKRSFKFPAPYLIWIILFGLIAYRLIAGSSPAVKEIPYSTFKTALNAGQITSVLMSDTAINGKMTDGTAFTTIRVNDPDLTKTLEAQKVVIQGQLASNGGILGFLLTWILPLVMMAGLWLLLFGRNRGGASSMGNIFSLWIT